MVVAGLGCDIAGRGSSRVDGNDVKNGTSCEESTLVGLGVWCCGRDLDSKEMESWSARMFPNAASPLTITHLAPMALPSLLKESSESPAVLGVATALEALLPRLVESAMVGLLCL